MMRDREIWREEKEEERILEAQGGKGITSLPIGRSYLPVARGAWERETPNEGTEEALKERTEREGERVV